MSIYHMLKPCSFTQTWGPLRNKDFIAMKWSGTLADVRKPMCFILILSDFACSSLAMVNTGPPRLLLKQLQSTSLKRMCHRYLNNQIDGLSDLNSADMQYPYCYKVRNIDFKRYLLKKKVKYQQKSFIVSEVICTHSMNWIILRHTLICF